MIESTRAAWRETAWNVFLGALPYLLIGQLWLYDHHDQPSLTAQLFAGGAPFMSLVVLAGTASFTLSALRPSAAATTARHVLMVFMILGSALFGASLRINPEAIPSTAKVVVLVATPVLIAVTWVAVKMRELQRMPRNESAT